MVKSLRPKYVPSVLCRLGYQLLLLSLALLASGCGGGDDGAPALADPGQALLRAPERLREVATFEFEAAFVETKRATPDVHTEYMTLEGALDLGADEGRTVVDMTWLGEELEELRPPDEPPDPGVEALFGAPVEIRWQGSDAYARLGDRWERAPRAKLRTGTLGTTAEEPANLVGLLVHAEEIRVAGTEDVGGEPTTHVLFRVDARRAGAAYVPAELYAAFEQELHGPHLRLEAWLDGEGLPRRLTYEVAKAEVRSGGKVVIPAKSIRVTYTLSGFGDDVDAGPPD